MPTTIFKILARYWKNALILACTTYYWPSHSFGTYKCPKYRSWGTMWWWFRVNHCEFRETVEETLSSCITRRPWYWGGTSYGVHQRCRILFYPWKRYWATLPSFSRFAVKKIQLRFGYVNPYQSGKKMTLWVTISKNIKYSDNQI